MPVPSLSAALSDPTINEGFSLALMGLAGDAGSAGDAGLAGDAGFLHTTSIPGVQIPGAAQVPIPTALTARSFLDRPLRLLAVNDRMRRASAAKHGLAGPVAAPPAARHPLALPTASSGMSPSTQAPPQPRASPYSSAPERAHGPAPVHQPVAMAVRAGPLGLTLSAGGPAAGAAGGAASGAGAVALAALLVLALLQLLSDRLSLELVPWRSTLLTLRLERPG